HITVSADVNVLGASLVNTITLDANTTGTNGNGGISWTAGTLKAGDINLIDQTVGGSGDIGTGALPVHTQTQGIGVLTGNGSGNVYITNNGSTILGGSSAGSGDVFSLTTTSLGSITIAGDVTVAGAGTINLNAAGDIVKGLSGALITGSGGDNGTVIMQAGGLFGIGSSIRQIATPTSSLSANASNRSVFVSASTRPL